MFYERMLSESRRLEEEICMLQAELRKLPAGKFFCAENGKYYKWYLTDGKNKTYIPKKDRILAEKLAVRKYLTLRLEDLSHEKRAIDFYLRHHNINEKRSEKLLQIPAYHELLSPHLIPLSEELHQWAVAPYEKNPKYQEQLIYKAASGNFVRSKSEVMIDLYLHTNKIPFRYEEALTINEMTFYPDFTIRHPETGSIYYWEHFGMIDNPSYCQNMISKLQLYTSHGIYPSIQLITTYETKNHPLNPEIVQKLIDFYFL